MVLRLRRPSYWRPSYLSLKLFGHGGGGRNKWRWKNEGGWLNVRRARKEKVLACFLSWCSFLVNVVGKFSLVGLQQKLNSPRLKFWVVLVCPPRASVWLVSSHMLWLFLCQVYLVSGGLFLSRLVIPRDNIESLRINSRCLGINLGTLSYPREYIYDVSNITLLFKVRCSYRVITYILVAYYCRGPHIILELGFFYYCPSWQP